MRTSFRVSTYGQLPIYVHGVRIRVDFRGGKLPGWYPVFKQQIKLRVSPASGLGQTQVYPNTGQKTSACPKIRSPGDAVSETTLLDRAAVS